jgi:hypothetical protein
MFKYSKLSAFVLITIVAACSDQSTNPSYQIAASASRSTVSDPAGTWMIPLSDAALSLRSDHQYGNGTYSVYANGVCNVSATIFATTANSNSGDATIQTSAPGRSKCGRLFTLVYPDAVTENVASFNNLREIENTSYSIPIGQTVLRRLVINPGTLANNPSRCGKLQFGGTATGTGAASDSLLVTRVDASTWEVQSQAAPHDTAYCEHNGQYYEMRVSFVVKSSYPLP